MEPHSHGNSHMERIQISVEEFQECFFQGSTQDTLQVIFHLPYMWNAFQMSSYWAASCSPFPCLNLLSHIPRFTEGWFSGFRRGNKKMLTEKKIAFARLLGDKMCFQAEVTVVVWNDWNSIAKWANRCSNRPIWRRAKGWEENKPPTSVFQAATDIYATLGLLKDGDAAAVCLRFNTERSSFLCLRCVATLQGFTPDLEAKWRASPLILASCTLMIALELGL